MLGTHQTGADKGSPPLKRFERNAFSKPSRRSWMEGFDLYAHLLYSNMGGGAFLLKDNAKGMNVPHR